MHLMLRQSTGFVGIYCLVNANQVYLEITHLKGQRIIRNKILNVDQQVVCSAQLCQSHESHLVVIDSLNSITSSSWQVKLIWHYD